MYNGEHSANSKKKNNEKFDYGMSDCVSVSHVPFPIQFETDS